MGPVYPEDADLARIGRLTYSIASVEWTMLGDLDRHGRSLPADVSVRVLAGLTTTKIGERLVAAASETTVPELERWLRVGGEHLKAIAQIRNHLLHARPATVEGKQRLYRWRLTRAGGDAFPVSDAWLEEQIVEVERRGAELSSLRVPPPETSTR